MSKIHNADLRHQETACSSRAKNTPPSPPSSKKILWVKSKKAPVLQALMHTPWRMTCMAPLPFPLPISPTSYAISVSPCFVFLYFFSVLLSSSSCLLLLFVPPFPISSFSSFIFFLFSLPIFLFHRPLFSPYSSSCSFSSLFLPPPPLQQSRSPSPSPPNSPFSLRHLNSPFLPFPLPFLPSCEADCHPCCNPSSPPPTHPLPPPLPLFGIIPRFLLPPPTLPPPFPTHIPPPTLTPHSPLLPLPSCSTETAVLLPRPPRVHGAASCHTPCTLDTERSEAQNLLPWQPA